MQTDMKVAIIGLDTSHSIEFTRRMQAADCPVESKVDGMKVVTCLRFKTPFTAVVIVEYPESRRGIVELTIGAYVYGGSLKTKDKNQSYIVNNTMIYTEQLREIYHFFQSAETSTSMADALEVMNLLDAAARSYDTNEAVMLNLS